MRFMRPEDKRLHPRIEVSTEVRISGPLGVATGMLRNLSKGGAEMFLAEKVANVGESVELFIGFSDKLEVAVMGEVLRLRESSRGFVTALRFDLIEPSMHDNLFNLIEAFLEARGSAERKHPRIARRYPIRYGHPKELKAMLENISMGGLAMTVPEPLVLDEEIEVSIPDLTGNELLIVRGKVVHQQPEKRGDETTIRVGLQFRNLTREVEGCLQSLIQGLMAEDEKKE